MSISSGAMVVVMMMMTTMICKGAESSPTATLLLLAIPVVSIAAICINRSGIAWILGYTSSIWTTAAAAAAVAAGRTIKEQKIKNIKGFPPGPPAWPLLGHLPLLTNLPHQVLHDLSRQYGPIVGLRLGQQPAIVVSSPALAKEVLHTHDKVFANRPPFQLNDLILYGQNSNIIFSELCPKWRKLRKICTLGLFTAKRLKDMEYVRQEELAILLRDLHHKWSSSAGCATAPVVDIGRCVSDMSTRLIMRLLQSEAGVILGAEYLPEFMKELEHEVNPPNFGDFIPALSWLDFWRKRRMRRLHDRVDDALSALITQRKQAMAASSSSTFDDLLQILLAKEVDPCKTPSTSSPLQDTLTLNEIKTIILDMLTGGVHATALTIEWAMAELLRNPHCMQRLRQELDEVLEREKSMGEEQLKKQIIMRNADVAKLSYLNCVMKEAARLHPVVPMLVPRISTEECEVGGYRIPARTVAFVNVWAIGKDEGVWGADAGQFRPERFEGAGEAAAIEMRGQHYELLPFGSGRRICPGMPLGFSVTEVTLANLVSCFDWELPHGQTPLSLDMRERSGITTVKATPTMAIPKPRRSSFIVTAPPATVPSSSSSPI